MEVAIYDTDKEMAAAAAQRAAQELSRRIVRNGRATFMAATGASQLNFLDALTREPGVDWSKTVMYHLDEYIGLPESHPASFRRYLRERLIDIVHPGVVHLIDGNAPDPEKECARLAHLVAQDGIDIAFVGFGENAHLGFNDPPADFETDALFTVVHLSDTCRAQQVHEGWFETVDEVPPQAITVTIPGILKSQTIICVVPEARKAQAVQCALAGPVDPSCPSSVLRNHPNTCLYLDVDSARLLEGASVGRYPAETHVRGGGPRY